MGSGCSDRVEDLNVSRVVQTLSHVDGRLTIISTIFGYIGGSILRILRGEN